MTSSVGLKLIATSLRGVPIALPDRSRNGTPAHRQVSTASTTSDAKDDVLVGPIGPDGRIAAWTRAVALPEASQGAGAALVGGSVVYAGGFGLSAPLDQAFAAILFEGGIGGWTRQHDDAVRAVQQIIGNTFVRRVHDFS